MKASKRNEARKVAAAEKKAAGKPRVSKYEAKVRKEYARGEREYEG